jgi:hypothetical protein
VEALPLAKHAVLSACAAAAAAATSTTSTEHTPRLQHPVKLRDIARNDGRSSSAMHTQHFAARSDENVGGSATPSRVAACARGMQRSDTAAVGGRERTHRTVATRAAATQQQQQAQRRHMRRSDVPMPPGRAQDDGRAGDACERQWRRRRNDVRPARTARTLHIHNSDKRAHRDAHATAQQHAPRR